jgi:ABC-2 type transport system ATP-binding protein
LAALDTTANLLAKYRPPGMAPKVLGDDGAADLEAVFVKIMAENQ